MKRKITITMKSSRRLTTFCLTGALALGASGGALAAGNDAALQALFAQANYWHEKSHDELAMESLQKVLSVDANNTQALYLMALWSQQGGDMQAAAQWRARLAKAAPDSPGLQDLDNAKKCRRCRRASSVWLASRRAAAISPARWRPGAACSMAIRRLPGWRRNIT